MCADRNAQEGAIMDRRRWHRRSSSPQYRKDFLEFRLDTAIQRMNQRLYRKIISFFGLKSSKCREIRPIEKNWKLSESL
uniref:Uncharacterized protein n=1 Tax=Ditylenchus dipsaci TaxID=166011 RepID=A0A915CX50_9BILA